MRELMGGGGEGVASIHGSFQHRIVWAAALVAVKTPSSGIDWSSDRRDGYGLFRPGTAGAAH